MRFPFLTASSLLLPCPPPPSNIEFDKKILKKYIEGFSFTGSCLLLLRPPPYFLTPLSSSTSTHLGRSLKGVTPLVNWERIILQTISLFLSLLFFSGGAEAKQPGDCRPLLGLLEVTQYFRRERSVFTHDFTLILYQFYYLLLYVCIINFQVAHGAHS